MGKYGAKKLDSEEIRSLIKRLTNKNTKTLWIAYSGGLDSHVLLDLVVKSCTEDYKVAAVHVHHGLSQNADAWVKHCKRICTDYNISLEILFVDAKIKAGESPEAMARDARLTAWKNFLQHNDTLLLAHHESDQAETILLRLFRGSGPSGLGGMHMKSKLGEQDLLRPLLKYSKESIRQYAKIHHLQWIEDESNQNTQFDRNYLRLEIMPKLTARWPRVTESINRAGGLCLETAAAIHAFAEHDFRSIREPDSETLSVKKLLSLDTLRRHSVIRFWLRSQGFLLPSKDHMERIDREILMAQSGAKPRLKIKDYLIRRLKGELVVTAIE